MSFEKFSKVLEIGGITINRNPVGVYAGQGLSPLMKKACTIPGLMHMTNRR